MRALTRQWMEAGAVGLNAGLDYQPGANSDTRELVELASVVGEYGGVYAAHMRYSGVGIRDAFRETMRISVEAGIPVSVSHYQYEQGSARLDRRGARPTGGPTSRSSRTCTRRARRTS